MNGEGEGWRDLLSILTTFIGHKKKLIQAAAAAAANPLRLKEINLPPLLFFSISFPLSFTAAYKVAPLDAIYHARRKSQTDKLLMEIIDALQEKLYFSAT